MADPTHHTREEQERGVYAGESDAKEASRSGVHERGVPAPVVQPLPALPAERGKGVWDDVS